MCIGICLYIILKPSFSKALSAPHKTYIYIVHEHTLSYIIFVNMPQSHNNATERTQPHSKPSPR